jgi:hypothetical protein
MASGFFSKRSYGDTWKQPMFQAQHAQDARFLNYLLDLFPEEHSDPIFTKEGVIIPLLQNVVGSCLTTKWDLLLLTIGRPIACHTTFT